MSKEKVKKDEALLADELIDAEIAAQEPRPDEPLPEEADEKRSWTILKKCRRI